MENLINRHVIGLFLSVTKEQILFQTDKGNYCFSVYGDSDNKVTISSVSDLDTLIGQTILDARLCRVIHEYTHKEKCFLQLITEQGTCVIDMYSDNDCGGNIENSYSCNLIEFSPIQEILTKSEEI